MSDSRSPRTPTRMFESSGASRSHVFVDNDTLNRMIETFGPLEYSQFLATYQQQQAENEGDNQAESSSTTRKETLLEWFDRSVEKELEKRRDPTKSPTTLAADPALSPLKAKHALHLTKGTVERLAETSASRVELSSKLRTDFTTELSDAVEKLAQAETMCSYVEALQAAEEAAQNAPPEKAEQAAQASARAIESKFTKVKETIPGVRPIEVVGYVGITQPAAPKKN